MCSFTPQFSRIEGRSSDWSGDETTMKSVKAFFDPAAKKCGYQEKAISPMAETERLGEASMRRDESLNQGTDFNTAGNSALSVPNHTEDPFDMSLSTSGPLGHERGMENPFVTDCHKEHDVFEIDPSLQEPLFSSPSALGRRWHSLRRSCYRQQRSQNFSFKVVSYNLLADGLLHSNSNLYTGTEKWLQQWEYRRRNLLQEMLYYNADVLCLQEVENSHYEDWFEPKLRERGYTGMFKKRTRNKTDGCATFFKHSRFTLVKSKLISFRKPGVRLMDRDNVAIVVLLKPRTTSRHSNSLVCVSNTHLLFNKKRGDIKLAQLACLFAEIDEVARISSSEEGACYYHPIICCGDFNSTPYSPIYNFVVRGKLDYHGMHRDNVSGQNHFRANFPLWQALTNNVIPWELGITASCIKRNDCSEKVEDLCISHEKPKANFEPSVPKGNCATSSELNHSMQHVSQPQNIKGGLVDRRNAANGFVNTTGHDSWELPGNSVLGSMQYHAKENTEFPSAHCSTSLSKGSSFTESQPLNSLNTEGVCHEGEQTSSESTVNTSERNLHDACTVQRHAFNFFSVYRHHFRDGQPEVTTFHDKACTTVDYMFVSPGLQRPCRRCRSQHGPLQMTGNLELLSEDDFWSLGGLPNRFISSDHLSLVSSFLLHV